MIARRLLPLLALACVACGSRGDPLPPLRPVPPAIPELQVAQRGTLAVLRFPPPPMAVDAGTGPKPLDRVELLVLAERYPALTPELLATALEKERRSRLEEARQAAAEVERENALRAGEQGAGQQAAAREQVAANEESVETEEAPEQPLTAAERMLLQVPRDALRSWREAGVDPAAVLEGAEKLDAAVDSLWDDLKLPTAIVDLRRPPALPDPTEIIAAARKVVARTHYETTMDPQLFLDRASIAKTVLPDELEQLIRGDRAEISYPVGVPSNGPIRTRYFFAVRTVIGKHEGAVAHVAALAPAAVPLPPEQLTATVVPAGVELTWQPPAGDLWGQPLLPEDVQFNVYRRPEGQPWFPSQPANPLPISDNQWLDTEMTWDQRYVYAVRALRATGAQMAESAGAVPAQPAAETAPVTVSMESDAATSDVVAVLDVFAPPPVTALTALRAGSRVTLRWSATTAPDLDGYRVYRHAAPAPPLEPEPPAPRERRHSRTPGKTAAAANEQGQQAGQAQEQGAQQQAAGQAQQAAPGQEQAGKPQVSAQARPRRGNPLLRAGWEMLTPTPITERRYIDPTADADQEWVYLVEAIDRSGNVSPPVSVSVQVEVQR